MLNIHVVEYVQYDPDHVYEMPVPDGNINMDPI